MKNKNVQLVKNEILRRKIGKYFTENKNTNHVLVHGKFGKTQVFWSVAKKGNSLSITEVNTSRNQFQNKEELPIKTAVHGVPANISQKPIAGTMSTDAPKIKPISSDLWDPDNAKGKYAELVQKVGSRKAMLSMPEDKLKKYFGISRKHMTSKTSPMGKSIARHQQKLGRRKSAEKEKDAFEPLDRFGRQKTGTVPRENISLKEGSPAFARISTDFMDGVSTFDHAKLSKAQKTLQTNMGQLKDPKEIEQAGKISGVLTGLIDQTTGQSALTRGAKQPLARITPAKKMVSAGRKYNYKFVLKN